MEPQRVVRSRYQNPSAGLTAYVQTDPRSRSQSADLSLSLSQLSKRRGAAGIAPGLEDTPGFARCLTFSHASPPFDGVELALSLATRAGTDSHGSIGLGWRCAWSSGEYCLCREAKADQLGWWCCSCWFYVVSSVLVRSGLSVRCRILSLYQGHIYPTFPKMVLVLLLKSIKVCLLQNEE